MPKDIESFVKTLESEGVDAGRKAAEKIKADAGEQADKIISEAKTEAQQIIAEAKAEAEKIKARMNSSLELATRDAIFMLREKLSQQLSALLNWNVQKALDNEKTLADLLCEVIPVYAKADAEKGQAAEISVPKDMKNHLLESAVKELTDSLRNSNVQVDVKHNLAKAGFEYKIKGSTVEVSPESVTALLSEMIDPELQQFLEKAANAKD